MATAPYAAPLGTPRFKWWDNTGAPLAAGQVLIQLGGSTINDVSYPTYTDGIGGTNPNGNPIILDSNGEASIFLQSGRLYKITVKTPVAAGGAVLYTMDAFNPAAGYPMAIQGAPFVSEWTIEPNIFAYLSATSFRIFGVDLTATYHVGRRVRTVNTAGTVYSTVSAVAFTGGNTNVTLVNTPTTQLDSGLSQVAYGLSYANPSYLDPRTILSVTKSGNQTGFSGGSRVTGWSIERDALGEWNVGTNAWICVYPGDYDVVFSAEVSDTGVSVACNLYIIKNSAPIGSASGLSTNFTSPVASNHSTFTAAHTLRLAAGDTISASIAGSGNLVAYAGVSTQLAVKRNP